LLDGSGRIPILKMNQYFMQFCWTCCLPAGSIPVRGHCCAISAHQLGGVLSCYHDTTLSAAYSWRDSSAKIHQWLIPLKTQLITNNSHILFQRYLPTKTARLLCHLSSPTSSQRTPSYQRHKRRRLFHMEMDLPCLTIHARSVISGNVRIANSCR